MITIFNRRELLITMDLNKQADVRGILSANNIPYVTKTTNLAWLVWLMKTVPFVEVATQDINVESVYRFETKEGLFISDYIY